MTKINLKNSSFMASFPETYLADLGRVIAAWSHVEHQFDLLFLSIVVMEGRGSGSMKDPRVRMMGEAFERRMRMFREAVFKPNNSEQTNKRLDRILSQLSKLRFERDTIAHSLFSPMIGADRQFSTDAAMAFIKSWRNQKPHEAKPITQTYLKRTFVKIHALYWDMFELSRDRELFRQKPGDGMHISK